MPIFYDKLWKLLIDKDIKKTELANIAGLNSRTLAKLSKGQTVSTETICRICDALDCDVSDIMEYSNNLTVRSIYDAYKMYGKTVAENENYKTVTFSFGEQAFILYETVKSIGKSTIIHCRDDGTITREDLYPFGGIMKPSQVESVLIKPTLQKNCITIVVITGTPGDITGLDEGIIRSSRNPNGDRYIYVMSMAAFKLFKIYGA